MSRSTLSQRSTITAVALNLAGISLVALKIQTASGWIFLAVKPLFQSLYSKAVLALESKRQGYFGLPVPLTTFSRRVPVGVPSLALISGVQEEPILPQNRILM
jgi:hypothetical protein